MEETECPSCGSIKIVTHRIILDDYAVCEIRYQCDAEIIKTLPMAGDKTSGYTWVKACYLRKPDR